LLRLGLGPFCNPGRHCTLTSIELQGVGVGITEPSILQKRGETQRGTTVYVIL